MATKPLIMPEAFTGVVLHHFECVVDMNKWETNTDKLKWFKVRLAGRALKAFPANCSMVMSYHALV